ncbi:MAG TPA: YlxM family DNA-binding protein [Firmicutes bacterium]|jgi:predicted DNA-binding protein YlxM (UPF0122 family)|nr:YlxM family DNA-binding protein [Bacillota bacterium]
MLDKLNRTNLLYDIYGSLLTERQREMMRLYYSFNLSLAEIAEERGVSRQAVHDLIQRALASIEDFEEKLGLYEIYRFQESLLQEAGKILEKPVGAGEQQRLREIISELQQKIDQ